MKIISLCALHGLNISESADDFEFNNIQLVKGIEVLDFEIFTPSFIEQAGKINCRTFLNKPFFIKIEDVDLANQKLLLSSYKIFKNEIRIVLDNLWFIKDNSVNTFGFYSFAPEFEHRYYISTPESAGNTKANADIVDVEFSLQDFMDSVDMVSRISELLTENKRLQEAFAESFEPVSPTKSPAHFINHNTTNRIDRSLMFWGAARLEKLLPLKISLFMSVFECLFSSTDAAEISHKMSERVSFYIGGDYLSKVANYKAIKKAYDVRSKFFHGQKQQASKGQVENLAEISIEIDEILRWVLNKVIVEDSQIFLSKEDDLNEYFNEIIFG